MQINELMHLAKDKVIQLREVIISPVPLQQWRHYMESVDRWDTGLLLQAKRRLALVLMIVGIITVIGSLVGIFISPGVQRRGAEMQRIQKEFHEGKIDWKQFNKAYQEAIRK